MTAFVNYIEIAARQSIAIPCNLAVQLSKVRNVADLRDFLDELATAEASAEILVNTELHTAAGRRLDGLGFGPADYDQSKQIMLGVIFSCEVSQELEDEVDETHRRVA